MEADIIEEVARLHGYGNIPTTMPLANIEPTEGVEERELRALKDVLTVHGYSEAVNYSFMNTSDLDSMGIGDNDPRRKCVGLMNPLRSEDAHLRTTLLPSLVRNAAQNLARGSLEVRLFEAARVFMDEGGELPREPMKLGAVLIAEAGPALYPESAEPFYLIKGTVEALLGLLRLTDLSFEPSGEPFLHPGKGAEVLAGGKSAGYLGVLSPDMVSRFDIKTRREVAVFELDLETVSGAVPARPSYSSVPRFPAVERDVALVLDRSVRSADVLAEIREHKSEFVEEASVFDLYTGKGVPEGRKSLAFNIRYRSPDRTLTDEEVDSMHEEIVKRLLSRTGGSLRGA
jgi:phenylalanyl-tRNA synthetase beta chain